MLALRRRLGPVLAVYFGAPVCAEYLQAYLSLTGNALQLLGGLLFLGPLYGGAALLIREAAVRSGLGWRGVLLLAAAFGVAMPGLIDLSLLGEHRADVPYWEELRRPTLIEPLGVAAGPTLGWVTGHVLMSVGAPLALLHALAPQQRGRPLLGRTGIAVVTGLGAVAAALVHIDGRQMYDYSPGPGQVVGVAVVVSALGAAAFSRWGRPLPADPSGRPVAPAAILLGGLAGKLLIDLLPSTWVGTAGRAAVLLLGAAAIHRLAVTRRWEAREFGLLAAAAIIGGTITGFLSPVPEGVSVAAKYVQNSVLLALAVAIAARVHRATARGEPSGHHGGTGHAGPCGDRSPGTRRRNDRGEP
ncbi:hypothetical protein [Streptomonospora alba]|uniref:hypothetical protein n=1 Tax=Streptomonospora alba TaxID=183763 RepID=UPI00069A690C|nr:hypothetical protein [Streptomonospora alba]